jgi:hypothetical protein
LYSLLEEYLPPTPDDNREASSQARTTPTLNTPEGLESIMAQMGFGDTQVIFEAVEVVYSDNEELWTALWSAGFRDALERIEETSGHDGLEAFRTEAFKSLQALKQVDGIHMRIPVLFTLAMKPESSDRV